MNLEDIEERCLNYLAQTAEPLVPVRSLLGFLRRETGNDAIGERELIAFLNRHEWVCVVGMGESGGDVPELLEKLGMISGPRVILKSRFPTPAEMVALMRTQLDQIDAALEAALDEARRAGNDVHAAQTETVLRRAAQFRANIEKAFPQQVE